MDGGDVHYHRPRGNGEGPLILVILHGASGNHAGLHVRRLSAEKVAGPLPTSLSWTGPGLGYGASGRDQNSARAFNTAAESPRLQAKLLQQGHRLQIGAPQAHCLWPLATGGAVALAWALENPG